MPRKYRSDGHWSLLLVLLLVTSSPAEAYLDPGTGSMLLQITLAGLAAGIVSLKLFWRRIVDTLRRPRSRNQDETS